MDNMVNRLLKALLRTVSTVLVRRAPTSNRTEASTIHLVPEPVAPSVLPAASAPRISGRIKRQYPGQKRRYRRRRK